MSLSKRVGSFLTRHSAASRGPLQPFTPTPLPLRLLSAFLERLDVRRVGVGGAPQQQIHFLAALI